MQRIMLWGDESDGCSIAVDTPDDCGVVRLVVGTHIVYRLSQGIKVQLMIDEAKRLHAAIADAIFEAEKNMEAIRVEREKNMEAKRGKAGPVVDEECDLPI
jgi:hypothetical protein